LKVVTGANVYGGYNQFGGTDPERASDLQQMLDDDDIRAVICSRGGYGTVRIIDLIRFSRFRSKPKWIVGYSDITVLHSHINQCLGIETIHAPMPAEFSPEREVPLDQGSVRLLREVLFGNIPEYSVPPHHLSRHGNARGVLAGGNLSVLCSIAGSLSALNGKDKILFIEDNGEYLYHIDRMLMVLTRSGMLERVKGVVVGGMTNMKDNEVPFGKTAEEIVLQAVDRYDYPVLFGFPAGHQPTNNPLIFGREIDLSVSESTGRLSYAR
jgi:muramoyltetrapeptide carboxypeptidase